MQSLLAAVRVRNETHPPRIIGIAGVGRSGKDSTGRALRDEFKYEPLAFARGIKDLVYEVDPYLPELGRAYRSVIDELGEEKAKETHPCIRATWNKYGQAAVKTIHAEVWIHATLAKAYECARSVITDVRLESEVAAVRASKGEIWYVMRPNTNAKSELDKNIAPEMCDRVIHNDGSLDDLVTLVTLAYERSCDCYNLSVERGSFPDVQWHYMLDPSDRTKAVEARVELHTAKEAR